eukprot:1064508-Prymnesium_polylepis.1
MPSEGPGYRLSRKWSRVPVSLIEEMTCALDAPSAGRQRAHTGSTDERLFPLRSHLHLALTRFLRSPGDNDAARAPTSIVSY